MFLCLNSQRQKQSHDCGFNHNICQHESVGYWVNGRSADWNIDKDWCCSAGFESHTEQEQISRSLHDHQTHNEMNEVSAGNDSIESHHKKPSRYTKRQHSEKFMHCDLLVLHLACNTPTFA